MKKTPKVNPIQFGENIPGTNLVTRFQGGKEIHPAFIPPHPERMTVGSQCDEAFAQAIAAGRRSVQVCGDTYCLVDGNWYVWDITAPA